MTEKVYLSCPNFQAVIVGLDGDKLLVARLRCNMWTCPYCAAIKQKMWRARVIEHIENAGGLWTWFTLTAHSKMRGLASLFNIRKAWDTLMKRMKRKYGKFQYCRVYERHKDGSYHLHAIANFHFGDIKERKARKDGTKTKYSVWLKVNATELRLGYYTHADDIKIEHSGYIASYVTKYMTKLSDVAKGEFGRIRRIQVSQGWAKWKRDDTGMTWQRETGIFEQDVIAASELKLRYVDVATGENITTDNFIDHIVFPPEFDANFKQWLIRTGVIVPN
jgi:hypothetical protein